MEVKHDGFGIWRSMGEEKPKENGDYLVYTDYGQIEIAFWDDSYWIGNDSYPVRDVDFWMPLAAKPSLTEQGGRK